MRPERAHAVHSHQLLAFIYFILSLSLSASYESLIQVENPTGYREDVRALKMNLRVLNVNLVVALLIYVYPPPLILRKH